MLKLHYASWGNEHARTLFCVHGLTRNGLDFEKLALQAAGMGFRVIAPDMPGRGQSPSMDDPALYNNFSYSALCVQLIQELGLSKLCWLGTSMGGIIGMMVANQYPELISKLILNDVGCVVPAQALARIGGYVADNPFVPTYAEAEARLRERTITFGVPEQDWQGFARNSIIQQREGFRLAYDPAIAQAFKHADPTQDAVLWPMWDAVKAIPTLLIRGEHSDLLSEDIAYAMQLNHPHLMRYNVADVGHAPALMTEAEIQAVTAFIR